ncbi:hypothetical protein GWI33_004812 [Rhynchophorus ferrugineus]|uniref:Uncharacterized protein n=1 Tax=Rhynchophorus ferrugineus TaxID=354439 RepID=A0A834MEA3_RHYFE|nr:hypothetical protein GWI33_004812 [Rhynchophorus ferrugineus]
MREDINIKKGTGHGKKLSDEESKRPCPAVFCFSRYSRLARNAYNRFGSLLLPSPHAPSTLGKKDEIGVRGVGDRGGNGASSA